MSKLKALLLIPLLVVSFASTLAPAHAASTACTNADCRTPPPPPPPPPPPEKPGNPAVPDGPGTPAWNETHKVSVIIGCRVSGDPKLLPDDLKFRNLGSVKIEQGTRVAWQIKETGEHGTFLVPVDLQPGDEVPDAAALAAGIPRTSHCFSNIA